MEPEPTTILIIIFIVILIIAIIYNFLSKKTTIDNFSNTPTVLVFLSNGCPHCVQYKNNDDHKITSELINILEEIVWKK